MPSHDALGRAAFFEEKIHSYNGGCGDSAEEAAALSTMKVFGDVKVPLSDGVQLSADIYLPDRSGKHPTVLMMTPYGTRNAPEADDPRAIAARFVPGGYVHVAVNVRGRYDSQGSWYPMRPHGLAGVQDEGKDGSEVISWIARQPWSNGKVATIGYSYPGWNQFPISRERNPHHLAMMPSRSPTDPFLDMWKWNGVPTLEYTVGWAFSMAATRSGGSNQYEFESQYRLNPKRAMWHLPVDSLDELLMGRQVQWWRDWLSHDSLDAYWAPIEMTGHYQDLDIPAFHHAGWYDDMIRGDLRAYQNMVRRAPDPWSHVLVIGPWRHKDLTNDPKFALRDFGPNASLNVAKMQEKWLDTRVKPSTHHVAPLPFPPVTYFLQGANEWRQAQRWPVPGTEFTTYYLDSDGHANTLNGSGTLSTDIGQGAPDSYVYNPSNPVPSLWSEGPVWVTPSEPADGRQIQARQDVLVYTTAPLSEPLEITGPVKAVIFFSTDVPDTDFSVKLFDVDQRGVAYPVSFGIKSARHRNSYASPEPLVPGNVYSIEVEMQPTSNLFLPRHRIRVQVTSSDFPYFIRNLNTFQNNGTTAEMRTAHIRIEHDTAHASHVVLPVVPAKDSHPAEIAEFILPSSRGR